MVGLWSLCFASDSSILVEVTDKEDAATAVLWVHAAFHCLERLQAKYPSIQNLHPAYRSLLIEFDADRFSAHISGPEILLARVHEALAGLKDSDLPSVQLPGKPSQPTSGASVQASSGRLIEVPVVYGGSCGPDLEDVARLTGLSIDDVIRRHSSVVYDVAFLGFSPGFPYLLGLPQELNCPRKAEPRVRVPAGSVAIGGSQTGIYPEDTPGGWQIIGRAQVRLFDPAQTPPTLLAPGDRLRFVPASQETS